HPARPSAATVVRIRLRACANSIAVSGNDTAIVGLISPVCWGPFHARWAGPSVPPKGLRPGPPEGERSPWERPCGEPPLAKEELVDRVVGFVDAGVRERVEEVLEGFLVGLGNLDADQDATVVGALVAVMEEADVPARVHCCQEAHQRARPLGELEAVE